MLNGLIYVLLRQNDVIIIITLIRVNFSSESISVFCPVYLLTWLVISYLLMNSLILTI